MSQVNRYGHGGTVVHKDFFIDFLKKLLAKNILDPGPVFAVLGAGVLTMSSIYRNLAT